MTKFIWRRYTVFNMVLCEYFKTKVVIETKVRPKCAQSKITLLVLRESWLPCSLSCVYLLCPDCAKRGVLRNPLWWFDYGLYFVSAWLSSRLSYLLTKGMFTGNVCRHERLAFLLPKSRHILRCMFSDCAAISFYHYW